MDALTILFNYAMYTKATVDNLCIIWNFCNKTLRV